LTLPKRGEFVLDDRPLGAIFLGMKKYIFLPLLLVLTLLSPLHLTGCASSPVGQISEEEINAQALKAYEEVKAKSKRSTNREWTEIVNRVADRIAASSGEKFNWEVILIESKEVNAWCMPGGKMAVYTGIMPVLKTEAALAAVMGHEVAHATRRHGLQRYARAMNQNLAGLVIGGAAALGGQMLCKTEQCKLLTGLGGVAAGFAITFFDRKFSRADETDADQVGQMYMAKAGYEPSESIRLWQRMSAASGGKAPPEFMSTHPSDERRQNDLRGWLPQAETAYERAPQKFGLGVAIR
jgi:predicted Zn-dependent protease